MMLLPLLAAMALAPQSNGVQLDISTYYAYPNLFPMTGAKKVQGVHFVIVVGPIEELSRKIQAFGKVPPTGNPQLNLRNGDAGAVSQTFIGRNGQKATDRIVIRPTRTADGFDLAVGVAPRQMRQDNLDLPVTAHVPDGQSAAIVLKRVDRMNTMRVFLVSLRPVG